TFLSIDEISQKVGIDHVSYFSVLFKKTTGHSPSNYRKKLL
ncbi:TPA: AraC family transcriptional regulator, partial [Enterococcus faecium]|nr:AraC family transcriptional regulator [Enterococcus faecium]